MFLISGFLISGLNCTYMFDTIPLGRDFSWHLNYYCHCSWLLPALCTCSQYWILAVLSSSSLYHLRYIIILFHWMFGEYQMLCQLFQSQTILFQVLRALKVIKLTPKGDVSILWVIPKRRNLFIQRKFHCWPRLLCQNVFIVINNLTTCEWWSDYNLRPRI